MTTQTAIPAQDAYHQALTWARARLAAGARSETLLAELIQQGWPEYEARPILSAAGIRPATPALSYATPARRDSSRHVRNMGVGLLMLVIGILITAATYSFASSGEGGGTYLVCYGPIFFGVVRLVSGFFGWIFGR